MIAYDKVRLQAVAKLVSVEQLRSKSYVRVTRR